MRHSRFCSAESALQNPIDGIPIAVVRSCYKVDTTLWTIIDTKKGRSFACIASKFNLFKLKIAARTYVNERNRIMNSQTLFDVI